jgi:hypothetical protein
MTKMTKKAPKQAQDFALQGLRAFQDVLFEAARRSDAERVNSMLLQFDDLLDRVFERRGRDNLELLEIRLQHLAQGEDETDLRNRYDREKVRSGIAGDLLLSKQQILFGLAGEFIEVYLKDHTEARRQIARAFLDRLPDKLVELTRVFESVSDSRTQDAWGWGWWDLKLDGKVHEVDSWSWINRAYAVKALQILASPLGASAEQSVLPASEDLIQLFDKNNQRSVASMLEKMQASEANFGGILSAEEFARVDAFLAFLERSRQAQEDAREARLVAAPVVQAKVDAFSRNVLKSATRSERLKVAAQKLGAYESKLDVKPGKLIPSWGYNQIDDKGAFIEDWYVSYPGWGDAYGRGMAHTEDRALFRAMVGAVGEAHSIRADSIIPEIEDRLLRAKIEKPVLFHCLRHTLEFGKLRHHDAFIPSYRQDCPKTALSGLDGFGGVLKVAKRDVPVFNVFMPDQDHRNVLVVADLAKLLKWTQYSPVDEPSDEQFTHVFLIVRVTDLGTDDERRAKILEQNPAWLADKEDKETYLKKRVVVNVYEKFKIEILDSNAGFSLSVPKKTE